MVLFFIIAPFINKSRARLSFCSCKRNILVACEYGKDSKGHSEFTEANKALPSGRSSDARSGVNSANLGFVGSDHIGISFVCTANDCNTRIVKSCRRHSYEKGTVVMQCPKCEKYHIISDHKNMYYQLTEGKVNIEEIAQAKGQKVTRVDNTTFKLEDLFGLFTHPLTLVLVK